MAAPRPGASQPLQRGTYGRSDSSSLLSQASTARCYILNRGDDSDYGSAYSSTVHSVHGSLRGARAAFFAELERIICDRCEAEPGQQIPKLVDFLRHDDDASWLDDARLADPARTDSYNFGERVRRNRAAILNPQSDKERAESEAVAALMRGEEGAEDFFDFGVFNIKKEKLNGGMAVSISRVAISVSYSWYVESERAGVHDDRDICTTIEITIHSVEAA